MTAPTADEIRNEPAGCRLDAWMDEYVMEWHVAVRYYCPACYGSKIAKDAITAGFGTERPA